MVRYSCVGVELQIRSETKMYILAASVFFEKKTINTYLKLEICVACREFIAFKYVVVFFSKQNR